MEHRFVTDEIKLGKKGQLTIPKKVRDEDFFKEGQIFKFVHTTDGDMIIKKKTIQNPEDKMIEIINSLPKIDWDKAWEEVLEERRREKR